uniref:Immunoglobulin superfamily, member 5a n=1 Tax=Sphaeramia orbicularis TaxID=375764 RepID=A0A672YHE9_9TELE
VCLFVCLSVCLSVSAVGLFQVEPLNLTKLRGSDAQFNATVQGSWKIMTWNVHGLLVLTVGFGGDVTSSSAQYSASFCRVDNSCVEFTIHNVSRSDSGPVVCTVQGDYGSRTAQLHVQGRTFNSRPFTEQGLDLHVECETSAWFPTPTISWTRNGQTVNSSLINTTSLASGDSFNSTSVLKFQAVTNTTVTCLVTIPTLTNPESSSVHLVVGKVLFFFFFFIGLFFFSPSKFYYYNAIYKKDQQQSTFREISNFLLKKKKKDDITPKKLTDGTFPKQMS